MRRKSERNKSKGSPEKKVEKATRKSTRRRGKRATSSSPEREDGEGKSLELSKSSETSAKESSTVQSAAAASPTTTTTTTTTRLKIKELKSIAEEEYEEDLSAKQITSSASDPSASSVASVSAANPNPNPAEEKIQEGIVGEGGSVWKVARADASPGEIQKLKLCRQRNPSEASDSSSSTRKKYNNKSYESGDGGDADEGGGGDSAEELTKSRKTGGVVDFARSERHDDPSSSSSNSGAQDRKEEVSLCSQVLTGNTTSSSSAKNNFFLLSDGGDKKNLDHHHHHRHHQRIAEDILTAQTADHGIETNDQQTTDSHNKENRYDDETSCNGDDDLTKDNDKKPQHDEEILDKFQKEVKQEIKEETTTTTTTTTTTAESTNETINIPIKNEDVDEEKPGVVEAPKESSSDEREEEEEEEKTCGKQDSPEILVGEVNRPELPKSSTRLIRRKHNRSKYRESSDSDTPESDDEVEKKIAEEEIKKKPVEKEEEAKTAEVVVENQAKSTDQGNRLSIVKEEQEAKKNSNEDREDEERANNFIDEKITEEANAGGRKDGYKPPKVNLKRSFSVRSAEVEDAAKKEDSEKNGESETPLQVKQENNGAVDETDVKSLPRKRRWGTTVTAEVTPAFTVSTDSLKALVPGAKPLSITEVRLSKDDDEEKARRKEREKRYSVGEDVGDKKIRDDVVGAVKNDGSKKGEMKHDNHIGAKRKISILKEAPRVKSPSPPSAKATNVLLIKNLVRPFTLNQIKELLSRTGTIVENGFWIDGIKSKCFVVYSNEDQAFETRQALHGISWPVSNPKRLQVEYASQEDMDLARELSKDQPIQRKAEPLLGGDNWQQVWARDEKQNVTAKVTTVREWDLGKDDGSSQAKEKEREKKDLDKKRRQRSRSPPIEPHLPPPARKFKKKEDEPPPAKLLDDLFKKTKAIPCIYWLPLTNEQIVVKEEMRRQHMAEHARRLEEMKRAERSRDPGSRRRRSPRK